MFSLIIVSFNTKEILKNALSSIFAYCPREMFEVIVIDNNSGDGSAEMLNNLFGDKIKLIINKHNAGFGAANNLGAKIARGEYLFFLNSDIIAKEDILSGLAKIFESRPEIGILAPRLILPDGSEQKFASGNFPSLADLILGKIKKDAAEKKYIKIDWVSGAALAIRKNLFDQAGGFDENFFMYFEDIDLCKRVKDISYQVAVLPSITVVHLGGKSLKNDRQRKKHYYVSQDYFYKKHYGKLKLALLRFFRWPYKLIILAK